VSDTELPEALVRLAQVVAQDSGLRARVLSFRELSEANRGEAFRLLAERMKAASEDADLTDAVALLAKPEIFSAVCGVLEEGAQ
jgi:hypothetical protein